MFRRASGFTLIEVMMVLVVVGILSAVSISIIGGNIDQSRYDATVAQMKALRNALTGDPTVFNGYERAAFGFAGDIGRAPTNAEGLAALVTNPALPAWSINSAARFALGWNGPYITGSGVATTFTKDAWGRSFTYDSTGDPIVITSLGSDGVAGGSLFNQDITVQIPKSLIAGNVSGFVTSNGAPISTTATVDLNYPVNGALNTASQNLTAAAQGYFSFSGVSLGRRSVTIYIPSKAAPTTTVGPMIFTMDNANFIVPSALTETVALAGGGGGGGGGSGPLTCTTPSNAIVFVNGSKTLGGGTKLTFNVNVAAALTISAVTVNAKSKGISVDSVKFGAGPWKCSGSRTLQPCPAPNATTTNLTPAATESAATNTGYEVDFTSSIAGESLVVITYFHNLGCDILNIPNP